MTRNAEIREFVLDNYPPAHQWEPKVVRDWTAWAAEQGFLFLCYSAQGKDGKLVGLTIARPLHIGRIGTEIADTDFDPDGTTIYVDLTISTAGKQAMKVMMVSLLNKMAGKPVIAFKRLKTKHKLKVYSTGEFASALLRR